ncbi:MAG: hypothetical protein AAFQ43_09960, partial [Bacteroidota bacterium]
PWLGIPGLNRAKLFIQSVFRSGQRYTPVEFVGNERNPFTGERDWRPIYETVDDQALRFSESGKPWWWFDLRAERRVAVAGSDLVFTLEVQNLFNQKNSVIINPVTGRAYPEFDVAEPDASLAETDPEAYADALQAYNEYIRGLRGNSDFDVTGSVRDPRYEDPDTSGLPPFNPARFLAPRHVVFGLSYRF